ncbi:MAG: xanthine dehydrogenase accessory factor [Candidatus Eremiobacteraeota bacterium]|jgi:xanthine dehydrogenase accessory factor|nr:xanthine dehydrogenase accessory factor [Candidatus Eremiobacteraeota bacterium]
MAGYGRLAELERERASFAVATVVARRAPVSSHVGDRAIVLADGRIEGFVGGSCSRDIVRREALRTLRSGQPRLVQIRPVGDADDNATPAHAGETADSRSAHARDECVVIAMGCASEGAVDVYIEPHVSHPRLLIVGDTPVADALARIAAQVPYEVVRVVLEAELAPLPPVPRVRTIALESLQRHLDDTGSDERSQLVAVVASQGHYDEIALAPLLAAQPAFVGLLASRRRAAAVKDVLAQQGVAPELLATLQVPVGLDIGARTPGDVAISIVAQIVAVSPRPRNDAADGEPEIAFDPVCGMEVELATALHRIEHAGRTHVFCCAGCRASFAAEHQLV